MLAARLGVNCVKVEGAGAEACGPPHSFGQSRLSQPVDRFGTNSRKVEAPRNRFQPSFRNYAEAKRFQLVGESVATMPVLSSK